MEHVLGHRDEFVETAQAVSDLGCCDSERETGFEPATHCLGSNCATTAPLPRGAFKYTPRPPARQAALAGRVRTGGREVLPRSPLRPASHILAGIGTSDPLGQQ